MSISLFDCTIREGKPLNGLGYGLDAISELECGLSEAGVNYIDVGYLSKDTILSGFAFYDDLAYAESLISHNSNTNWVISIMGGRNELNLIPKVHGQIKNIRFTVPFKDMDTLKTYTSFIKDKGYDVICEIDNIFGYNNRELLELVDAVNEAGISQIAISDSFGRVDENNLQRVYYLLDNNLNSEIRIGARFTDALAAYQMAQKLLELSDKNKREIVLEGSLFGIGDFQGNLCLEVIADYVNDFYGGNYNLDSLYKLIGKYIQPIAENQLWGYHPAFYLAGKYKVDSDYAQYLMDKAVPLEKIHEAIRELAKTQTYKEFNKAIAEKAYLLLSSREEIRMV